MEEPHSGEQTGILKTHTQWWEVEKEQQMKEKEAGFVDLEDAS